jgi:hypothetical protein
MRINKRVADSTEFSLSDDSFASIVKDVSDINKEKGDR